MFFCKSLYGGNKDKEEEEDRMHCIIFRVICMFIDKMYPSHSVLFVCLFSDYTR